MAQIFFMILRPLPTHMELPPHFQKKVITLLWTVESVELHKEIAYAYYIY